MITLIVNKFLLLVFILSCLTITRHLYYLVQAYFSSTEEQPVKYKLKPITLFYLGLSIAYALSTIFTGIKL